MTDSEADQLAGRKRRAPRPAAPAVDRLPPHSDEAEKGVLGCVLLDPQCLDKCLEKMGSGPQTFYDLRHQLIYEAFLYFNDQRQPIDVITLQQHLSDMDSLTQIGGIAYLNELQNAVPSAANLPYYLDIVVEKWQLRNIVQACTAVVSKVYDSDCQIDSLVGEVERKILSIEKSKINPTLDGKSAGNRLLLDLEKRLELQGRLSGLSTGIGMLDHMTEGLQAGEHTVIGARPSQGKTALGLGVVMHNAFHGIPALFVSLEMSVEAIMRRMCSIKTGIPLKTIRRGSYDEGHMKKFSDFNLLMNKVPLHIHDGVDGCGIREIASRVNRMVLTHGIKLVVIDYMQKIKPAERHEKRTYEVADVSGRLKALAHENKIHIITLAQLNRENVKGGKDDKGRPPRLSDLADSGQIERDADVVGLIHRDQTNNKTSLILAKQRDGEVGVIPLYFDRDTVHFSGVEDE